MNGITGWTLVIIRRRMLNQYSTRSRDIILSLAPIVDAHALTSGMVNRILFASLRVRVRCWVRVRVRVVL